MKKRAFWIVWLLLILLCTTVSLADTIAVSGCAFADTDRDGICSDGESLLAGVPVALETYCDGQWALICEAATDEYGRFALSAQEDDALYLTCALQEGGYCAASIAGEGSYIDGKLCLPVKASVEDANVALLPSAQVTVIAYADANSNASRGKYEEGVANVMVELVDTATGEARAKAETTKKNPSVLYVPVGEYTLRATLPFGYRFTGLGEMGDVAGDESVSESDSFNLSEGDEKTLYVAALPMGSLSGKAFEDMNNNGLMDEDDPGVAGVVVHLVGKKSGTVRDLVTGEDGLYCFERLVDDVYTITADLPEGMLYARYSTQGGDLRSIFTGDTTKREFTVKSAGNVTNKNIGLIQKGVIYGTAFYDLNYNGLWDEGEPGYKGVTVEAIKLSNNETLGKAVTDKDGSFRIEGLRGGDYRLRAILPNDGSVFTVVTEGGNPFAYRQGRRENSIQPLNVSSGGEASALIGVAMGATIRGTVFQDSDYSGTLNGKEQRISGIKVSAVDENGNVAATATTNGKGVYELSGLMPGKYTLRFQRKAKYGFTRLRPTQKGGSWVTVLDGNEGVTDPIDIVMAQVLEDINAGMLPSSTVSGLLFEDSNDNGAWDANENGMISAQMRLTSEDGEIDLICKPETDGSYFFDGVMPGKYTLTCELPAHSEMAKGSGNGMLQLNIKMGENVKAQTQGAVILGNFEGIVFDETNGQPVSDAHIVLRGIETKEVTSGADGSFAIDGLRPSEYVLSIDLPDGRIFARDTEELTLPVRSSYSDVCEWGILVSREEKKLATVIPAKITGQIWMDEDQNGVQGENEWLMQGLKLTLVDAANGMEADETISDETGYCFAYVRPGKYVIRFELPEQSEPAQDALSAFTCKGTSMHSREIFIEAGEEIGEIQGGLVSRTSIGGTLLLEENGVYTPVPSVMITLFQNGKEVQKTHTDENGVYRFDGLWPDTYSVRAELPSGMIYVRPNDDNFSGQSVIADAQSGESYEINLQMAQHRLNENVLFIKPARVGDLCWLDENANGLLDGDEMRLGGVKVSLLQEGETRYTTVTDANGYYLLADVYPGEYVLKAEAYEALKLTKCVQSLRIISTCLTQGDGKEAYSDSFRVASGESNKNMDLGYILPNGALLPAEAYEPPLSKNWLPMHNQFEISK